MKFRAVVEIMPLRRPWSTLKTCLKHLWKIVTTPTTTSTQPNLTTIEVGFEVIMTLHHHHPPPTKLLDQFKASYKVDISYVS